ncbi:MAG: twin-arginine translocase TatA/TatE family subunit [Deltaproteobacteria bacterium]|nr:twin-arginine translocase TatA/TatE family subunit [Deltaproteobacteria bacterium]
MSISEILLLLIVALIIIPPDRLPEVMRTAGKILRELRLASNTIVRELSGVIEDPPYLPERPHNNPMTAPWSEGPSDAAPNHEPSSAEPPPQA